MHLHKLGNTKIVYLNLTNSPATSSGYWNNTTPSSSVFTLGNDNKTNKSGDNYVAYCFNDVESFSKFGEYSGNNANDGTYVHLNFRPAFLMVKRTDSTRDWIIYDSARSTTNTIDDFLEANYASAEQTSSSRSVDFLSNGFKFRNNSGDMNGSGTYLYFAWAESPFKNANAR